MRTAREMGDRDRRRLFAKPIATRCTCAWPTKRTCIGPAAPAQSYLNVEKLLEVATRSGADAIHPGYGFLAENAAFARARHRRRASSGSARIPDAIDAMGDKLRARASDGRRPASRSCPAARTPIDDVDARARGRKSYGLPLALKASGGGGGKGLKVARTLDEIESAFTTRKREAEAYFKNATIYAERYLENPKHVELQILADKHGNVVHVGERDCSLQRRHQKLWEETPAQIRATRAPRDARGRRARRASDRLRLASARSSASSPATSSSSSR